jgi:hypothetical protein
MSPYDRPDVKALTDLERLIGQLTEELSGWRRRCLKAEAELQGVKGQQGMVPGDELVRLRTRLLDLERENLDLTTRVDRARSMVGSLRQRLSFAGSEADGNGQERLL